MVRIDMKNQLIESHMKYLRNYYELKVINICIQTTVDIYILPKQCIELWENRRKYSAMLIVQFFVVNPPVIVAFRAEKRYFAIG